MNKLATKVVHTYEASLKKVCWNHIPHQASLMQPVSVSGHKSPLNKDVASGNKSSWNIDAISDHKSPWVIDAASGRKSPWKTFGNPCLDMFHYLFPWIGNFPEPAHDTYDNYDYHLKRLLPHAWSYNPITTLKIIRNLTSFSGPNGAPMSDAFYWVHHNHPKTLAANLIPLMLPESGLHEFLTTILYRILDLKHIPGPDEMQEHVNEINDAIKAGTTKSIPEPLRILSNRVLFMYEKDPDFRLLHDQVANIFAQSLKFDIQNFLEKVHDYDCDKDQPLEVTEAAESCEGSPFLLESVARRIFPHEADVEAAVELLRNEVLAPLKKVLCPDVEKVERGPSINIYGYSHEYNESDPRRNPRRQLLDRYLKDLSKFPDKMVADALLPNELVDYVIGKNDGTVSRHVVELQWNAMVENLKKRQLMVLSSSLAVISCSCGARLSKLTYGMSILISELCKEEVWKGKVISMMLNPQLLSIEGHDLNSKYEFLRDPSKTLAHSPRNFDCKKVFDLILQQAVSGRLKPEQMIKKVFVFRFHWEDFEAVSGWEVRDYDEMRNKYREHGYDMPQIVFWRSDDHLHTPFTVSPDERGLAAISGFERACGSDMYTSGGVNFIKKFLENDGVMRPQHVMEAVLSDEDYRYSPPLVVLD